MGWLRKQQSVEHRFGVTISKDEGVRWGSLFVRLIFLIFFLVSSSVKLDQMKGHLYLVTTYSFHTFHLRLLRTDALINP